MTAQLTFSLSSPLNALRFAPRLGSVRLARPDSSCVIDLDTPNFTVSTSRGVVPHLSRDNVERSQPIRWIQIPFESFLDHVPPVPTLQTGEHPLHIFLGHPPSHHILSMCLRDPADFREMPPNGNDHVAAHCTRGVRKVTRSAWRSYIQDCKPDIVIALSDTPFTPLPHSQKRLTKSVQRSFTWLIDMFRPLPGTEVPLHPNVFVHMAGGSSGPARAAFAHSLVETLHEKEAADCKPHQCLDDGLAGYVFDLLPLRSALTLDNYMDTPNDDLQSFKLLPLIMTSLHPLSIQKLRLVNSAASPHEMLVLILHIGIDLFDSRWAQEAANRGIALDFRFPLPEETELERPGGQPPKKRTNGKVDLGHNLYDLIYAQDFSRLAKCFDTTHQDPLENENPIETRPPICNCAACSPTAPAMYISHSALDDEARELSDLDVVRPFTRAYIHHLLQTHEMSAHTLLVMHNIQVLDAFFTGVRSLLGSFESQSSFAAEVANFMAFYDDGCMLLDEASADWNAVDKARGKGRLAREKAQEAESNHTP